MKFGLAANQALKASLTVDPVPYLLDSGDTAVAAFTRRDFLGGRIGDIHEIWDLRDPRALRRGQHQNGSWGKPGGYPSCHHQMVETFKRLRLLIGRYEADRSLPEVDSGVEFLLSRQTSQGDFRGMIGDQLATYYTGEFTGLIIRAGFADDARVDAALRWLLSMRQDDGGWVVPVLAGIGRNGRSLVQLTGAPADSIAPDRAMPFSHVCTDMVLRAFAAHPRWRRHPEVRHAAKLLKSRFFCADAYRSYGDAHYWVRFVQWWPNLITSLESLAAIGLTGADPDVARALDWFREHQEGDGSWRTTYFPGNVVNPRVDRKERPWITLRVARLFARLGARKNRRSA